MSQYEIFSSPNLLSYLAKHLHHRSCIIAKEDISYYLHSSDIDYLCASNNKKSRRRIDGLLSVLNLISTDSNTSGVFDEVTCIKGLLSILNGGIKLKYGESNGLTRQLIIPSHSGIPGRTKHEQGIKTSKDFSGLVKIQLPLKHFRDADKQPPTMRRIWRIARRNPPVARALFHYVPQEDVVNNLRKVLEEIMTDTYQWTPPRSGKPKFDEWLKQGWTLPEVGMTKMKDLWAWLHNSDLSKDQALHSVAFVDKQQAIVVKAHGSMTLSDVTGIIRALLIKWISHK